MPITRFWLLACSLSFVTLVSPPLSRAPGACTARQDPRLIHEAVMSFLHSQSPGLPGEVEITPGASMPAYHLPACAALEAALPPQVTARGATRRSECTAPRPYHGQFMYALIVKSGR